MAQSDGPNEEVVLQEPRPDNQTDAPQGNIWMRGLWMLVLFALFGLAQSVLVAAAILQFCWMLFAKEKNGFIADFGVNLGKWLAKTARFQTGKSDEKPFPWTEWE